LAWGLLRACAACPTPRLNLSFELRPSWNNIHDTFPSGTAPDTTELLGVRCEAKKRGTCTHDEENKGVQHNLRGNQGSRESRNRQSSVRERADTASSGFEREPTMGLRRTPPAEVALVHETGLGEFLLN